MRNVIWLCSWYPNETDLFIGDFVQRHAQAVSQFVNIEVLVIIQTNFEKIERVEVSKSLIEHRVYIKKKNAFIDLLTSQQIHDQFIKNYIHRKGKPELIHVHVPIKAGLIALKWKRFYKIPFLLTEHYGIYNSLVKEPFSKRSFLFKYFTKRIFKEASRVMPVSEALANDLKREVIEREFQIVSNAVNTDLFNYVEKKLNEKFCFIHISSLNEVKNPNGILQAIERLSKLRNDFFVRIIGSTNIEFEQASKEKKLLNNFIFIQGAINYIDVAKANQEADAGLLFSHSESQSCVVLEWLCIGLPVISSEVGGVVELINNENGILVKSSNVDALVSAMSKLIDDSQHYNRAEISKNAIAKYSFETVGKKIASIYGEVLTK
jgi:glycosyltransferase involved in cell wall biosynthesis